MSENETALDRAQPSNTDLAKLIERQARTTAQLAEYVKDRLRVIEDRLDDLSRAQETRLATVESQILQMQAHRHLVKSDEWLEPVMTTATIMQVEESASNPAVETPPSSRATGSTTAPPSTSSTSLTSYYLVREDETGERIMGTVTFHEPSFTPIPGNVRDFLQGGRWKLRHLTTLESPSPSGSEPSSGKESTQEAPQAGPSAGTDNTPGYYVRPNMTPILERMRAYAAEFDRYGEEPHGDMVRQWARALDALEVVQDALKGRDSPDPGAGS